MNVNIYEPRRNYKALAVDDFRAVGLDFARRIDCCNFTVGEKQISGRIDAGGRIDQVPTADQDLIHRPALFSAFARGLASPLNARRMSAMRIATPFLT